ncbi:hypothetical protein QM012_007021 [Aureobasidium pullulans]|uniref:N-acetyltransferase domain-containing protein n=1 Tax=Aureobasidium pullulans TaxID=5580 RepID=A0ABR0TR71_AURPU
MALVVKAVSWDHPDPSRLRASQGQEINPTGLDEAGVIPTAADIAVFLVVYLGSNAVACGGLRHLVDVTEEICMDVAEIKRMFVIPEARGQSYQGQYTGEFLLRALSKEAKERGWLVLKLETGTTMTRARRFYERHGFTECSAFGTYDTSTASVFYRKLIA